MTGHIVSKMQAFVEFDEADLRALEEMCADPVDFRAGDTIVAEGDKPRHIHFLIAGWAERYKILHDGQRQILALLMPGDVCDVLAFILKKADHTIACLSACKVALVTPQKLLDVMAAHPRIERALWWSNLVDESILREWLVNVGRRDAFERICHLFCELALRARVAGVSDGLRLAVPLKQEQIGEAVGLTPVHVNRTLQRMRAEGLVTLGGGVLTICDPERLASVSGFVPNYLHLDRKGGNAA